MATTNAGFVVPTNSGLSGSTVLATPYVQPLNGTSADQLVAEAVATRLDKVLVDLSTAGYAKNGAAYLTLTGTTPITINVAALAAATGVVVGGDTAFATVYQIVLNNTGAVDVSIATGGSNPFNFPLTGTTPALTVAAGSKVTIQSVAGYAVDGTHKNLTITPTAGGTLGLSFGGA